MLNLAELNAMTRDEFVRTVGPAFEHSPWIAQRAAERRPFASREELHRTLCSVVSAAGEDEQLSLIRAHPDLVGDAVLTAESQGEQTSAGLMSLTTDEREQFREYNRRYGDAFGFPFVICARLNKKEAILGALPERLGHSRAKEVETALGEIYKIAELRLRDVVE